MLKIYFFSWVYLLVFPSINWSAKLSGYSFIWNWNIATDDIYEWMKSLKFAFYTKQAWQQLTTPPNTKHERKMTWKIYP